MIAKQNHVVKMLRWDECKISDSCMFEEEGIGNRSFDGTSHGKCKRWIDN
jgi:hypothetical protein